MQQKEILSYGSKVEIYDTNSESLDGKTGTLIGIHFEFPNNNFWIVGLDEPLKDRSAIVITDACLKLRSQ